MFFNGFLNILAKLNITDIDQKLYIKFEFPFLWIDVYYG